MGPDYRDREQTQIKHFALRSYLEAASRIIGLWKDFSFVDCCAGPWESRSQDYGDTSFGIAINTLRESDVWLQSRGKSSRMRALLIEERAESFQQLNAFAGQMNGERVRVEARNWDFRDHAAEIVRFVKHPDSFAFFFVDPTGWTPASVAGLGPLLAVRPCEVLINFMSSFVVRFLNDERTNMDEILGADYRAIRALPHEEQENEAVRRYCDLIRVQVGLSPWLTQAVKTLIAVRWKNLDRQDHCTAF
jgi:three-Cys-motif partner protein